MKEYPNIITEKEARRLNKARVLLDALEERAKQNGWLTTEESFSLGRFAESCDRAEAAIFDALNIASSHFDCLAARDAIDSRHPQEPVDA